MGELLPLAVGIVLGVVIGRLPGRLRAALIVPVSIVGGAAVSAINGELATGFWAVFVSLDALLVWAGVAVSSATVWYRKRLSSPA